MEESEKAEKIERMEKIKRYLLIANHLFTQPRQTYDEIVAATGLSKDTVNRTVSGMKHDGVLSNDYRVNLALLGYEQKYRVDIWVSPIHLRKGQGGRPGDEHIKVDTQENLARYITKLAEHKDFENSVYVDDVRILLGNPADLSADVYATNTDAMLAFVTRGLRMCRAITQTSSAQEAWSIRHQDRKLKKDLVLALRDRRR